MQNTARIQNNWPKRLDAKASGKKEILDRFQRELDASEHVAPMHNSYQRIDPYIVELEQAGHTYSLIIYHVESELWYARDNWFDHSFEQIHEASLIRRGDVIFDLGCNAGSMTCWYALATGPKGHVHAFDPFPWNAIATRYNAELNGLRNVTVHQVGVGANSEKIALSLYAAKTHSNNGPHVIEAQIHPLSSYTHLKPDVLKIDIEGAEHELSQADFYAFKRLRFCYLELHNWEFEERGLKPEECLHNFMRHGFELRRLPKDSRTIYDGSAAAATHGGYYLTRALPPSKPQHTGTGSPSAPLLRRAFHRLPSALQSPIRRAVGPLLSSHNDLIGKLQATVGERDAVVRQLQATVVEREAVVRELQATVVEREAVIREREAAIKEREGAIKEREGQTRECEERLVTLEGVLREGKALASGRESRIAVLEHLLRAHGVSGDGNGKWVADVLGSAAYQGLRAALRSKIIAALPGIEGWCTARKALWLADLIADEKCGMVLEVGIYGGRSFIPMAMALRACRPSGKAYGVEAWSNDVAVATETSSDNDAWWRAIDLKSIKAGFERNVSANNLEEVVTVFEMSSNDAFKAVKGMGLRPFDLIHIDGSHSEAQSLRDVQTWPELLRPGGVLVMDDITWPTVQAARNYVQSRFVPIEEIFESDGVAYGAYRSREAPAAQSGGITDETKLGAVNEDA